ncbi:spermidine/putrescine transport system ATP-binding protein [Neobacillus niacini]|uniref:ABC transporter ATP-binding protein n=1 Tax=Neobacillus driksii TaxID=3035913 RepID=UPI002781ABEE|nr:ABC transporter ATP-binding protein [Neobacillus niacini]MDQ0971269.1 spermidine/putrescine transport system ATP-binding protein [Neobacillus niacini]
MKTLIHLNNIEKKFGSQNVINPLEFSVYEGEFLTMLGPSGCGKTTLLRMIAGFEPPTSGDIYLLQNNITDLPPYKRDMNMVFQHYALFPHMNVENNILFGLRMKGISGKEQKMRLENVLELTRLTDLRHHKPHQLSGGQQQRVAIARAIINKPKVLLLDEPLGALDYQLRKSLQLELKSLQKEIGITFIYVTHDQEEALTMSDRIAILNNGKIEQAGTPQEIYRQPNNEFIATFIGENNIFHNGMRTYCVRPENVKVYRKGTIPLGKAPNGNIIEVIFSGNHTKVYIYFEQDQKTVVAYDYPDTPTDWKTGDAVDLDWNDGAEVRLD